MRGPGVVAVKCHHVEYVIDTAVRSGGPGGPAVAAGDDYALGVQRAVAARDAVLRIHKVHVPQGQLLVRYRNRLPGSPAIGGTHNIVAHAPAVLLVREDRIV